jgi:hypothetical protein
MLLQPKISAISLLFVLLNEVSDFRGLTELNIRKPVIYILEEQSARANRFRFLCRSQQELLGLKDLTELL